MSQRDLLFRMTTLLSDLGIHYMLAGSYGSSLHGEPRATYDIDMVIAPSRVQLLLLVDELSDGFYVSREAADEALRNRSMFNVIDLESGFKVDFIVRKERPFSIEEFRRRTNAEMMGMEVSVVTAEDLILSKLEWSRSSESERQFRDALGVAVVQLESLDREYLQRWAPDLGVSSLLERLLASAAELRD